MTKTGNRPRVALALVLALMGGVAVAQEGPTIDPRAERILTLMSRVLTDARQFTVHNDETSDELTTLGDLLELSSSVDLAVRRPGQAYVLLQGDVPPLRYWLGDGQLAMMDLTRWTYAVAPVPADLDAAIDVVWQRYGLKLPLADFISGSPYENLTRAVQTGFYVGLHDVQGVSCHHLAFQQEDIDWQIWIDDGLLPLPRKMLIVYKNEPGAPRYTAHFSEWDLAPDLGDTIFDFEPPDGAERIEFAEQGE